MATSNKDFKIKNGLIVEGDSATVNGNDVLTTASSIDDLADVDVTTATDGDTLVYDLDTETWVPAAGVVGPTGPIGPTGPTGADSNVTGPTGPTGPDGKYLKSETEPDEPEPGDIWFNTTTGSTYIYYDSYWVGVGGGTAYGNWQVINSNTTATANTGYIANTSAGSFTLIMPENPAVGESVAIIDGTESFKRNGLTISGGIELIEGRSDNLILNVDRASVLFRFIGSTYGWKVV